MSCAVKESSGRDGSFYTSIEAQKILGCGRSNAYRIIQRLNERRQMLGYLVIDGRVNATDLNDFCNADRQMERLKCLALPAKKEEGATFIANKSAEITQRLKNLSFEIDDVITDQSLITKRKRLERNITKHAKAVYTKNALGFSKLKSVPGKTTDKELAGLALALLDLGYLLDIYLNDNRLKDSIKAEARAIHKTVKQLLVELLPFNTVV